MSAHQPLILLIEDDAQMLRVLRLWLARHGYRVSQAMTAADGLARAAADAPDVILLDLGLPDHDGLDVVRRLREWSTTPMLVISGRGADADKIEALDLGADDYLTKPFSVDELLARIRVALRHAAHARAARRDPIFASGELRVDLAARQVWVTEAEVHLTPTEYRLLLVLVRHAGTVVTHQQLLQDVWGPHHFQDTAYLRVFMRQLRHKLETDPAHPRLLLNEPGVGYRLKLD
jgi:two-component system, OmpR family, KDP operon response regulator KdpE